MGKILKRTIFFLLLLLLDFELINAQQMVLFKGVVFDSQHHLVENVLVLNQQDETHVFTDEAGGFCLSIPARRSVEVLFRRVSYRDTVITVSLPAGKDTLFQIYLTPDGQMLSEISITDSYADSYTRIDPKLSFNMPSPTGGVESLLKSMPGTSSTNELSSQYNVRGGNYDENLIFVNDIQIYRPFLIRSAQQEGLSFVNMDLTESVKFSAGGFEAKYGDKMSSVLDIVYKKPKTFGGSLSASFLGVSAHAEGNVNDKFTYLVGIRYKSNSYMLKSMETSGDYKPNFFDTQMLLTWKLGNHWNLDFLGNFSRNKFKYIPHDRETNFGTFTIAQRFTVYFDGQEVDQYENYLGGLTLSYHPNEHHLFRAILSSYYAKESETYDIQSQYWLSDLEADLGSDDDEVAQATSMRSVGTFLEHARNYLTAVVTALDFRGQHKYSNNQVDWGIKVQNEIIHDQIREWERNDSSGFTLPHIHTTPGEMVPYDDPSRILNSSYFFATKNALNTYRFNGFVQSDWKIDPQEHFILNSGLRFHYWTFNKEFTVSPRFILSYIPHWEHDWQFRLKAGSYYQPPFYREMRRIDGTLNHSIRSQHSYQVALSADFNFKMWRRPFKLTMEGYYKYLTDIISYNIDDVKIIYSGENDAKGYAVGVDVKLSGELIRGLESWITLSLMSTKEDILGDFYYDENGKYVEPGYIPRLSDQRFAINIFFQDHIPFYTPLRLHLNFVFASGLPYGAPNAQRYQQVFRTSWYRRVDVGFSYMFLEQGRDKMKHKTAFARSIKNAGVFLEVFNVLGVNNVSSYLWITDVNNTMMAVPNYLTPRLINLKFMIEF